MTTFSDDDYLARLRRAAILIRNLNAELLAQKNAGSAPIAVIGMALRFPGGSTTPEEYWRTLEQGVDAVTEVPAARWPLDPAEQDGAEPERRAGRRRAARWGAFLRQDVGLFDARFFGVAPREARMMDPQQRLLLEVAWEALEGAGQAPDRLLGSRSGVFLGMMSNDYAELIAAARPEAQDVYAGTGNGRSFPAGRLSYVLGLQGPSLTVDTACSSSLVAVHLACQSLRSAESELALAGGVNLMFSPSMTRLTATTGALSPDGRCKALDARANGFVRGEGCGVVVLKRLADAQRDGDPILAVIRGSAVNQDGRSAGLTAPNVIAQQALLRQALENARLDAGDIGYVELHGTGTPLGDPIELEALRAVLSKPREDGSPCVLGAAKTNVGHLEAAAGVAGLIKAVLCLEHQAIPRNLHFETLNPRISLEGTPFVIPVETVPWKASGKPRRAGVSAFGMSGTNAHVILEEPPPLSGAQPPVEEASSYVVPLSAKSPEALAALASAYGSFLARGEARLHDIAYTASVRRSHHEQRLAVVGRSKDEVAGALGAFARGEGAPGLWQGEASAVAPNVAFVFPGHGAPWAGMGRTLLAEEPVFRRALEACSAALEPHTGFSVKDELERPEQTARSGETAAQPILFAIEVALAELLRALGVRPAAVLGYSVGEVAAAHVAGILDMDQAARLVAVRARVLQDAAGRGEAAPPERGFVEALGELAPRRGSLAMFSAVTGEMASGEELNAGYWRDNLRETARFARAARSAAAAGARLFVEVGPHPALSMHLEQVPAAAGEEGRVIPTLERQTDERRGLLEALGALHVQGVGVDWQKLYPQGGRVIPLPSYPWQRERYWIEPRSRGEPRQ